MPTIIDGISELPRKDLCVFYVLDTSGSMNGEPISILNSAMEETVQALCVEAEDNGDARVKIAAMTFNSNPHWVQENGPEYVEDFDWDDVTAGGTTNVGLALKALNEKLTPSEYLASKTGGLPPVIIFMTDGLPTDDYYSALDLCKQNKYFRHAVKIGIGVGRNADMEMLAHLTGDSEAVIQPRDLQTFAKLLVFASVVSSNLASKPDRSSVNTGAEVINKARQQWGTTDFVTPVTGNYTDPDMYPDDDDDTWATN